MSRHADLAWLDMRSPNLVLKKMGDIQTEIARALPDPAAHVERAGVEGVGPEVIQHRHEIAVRGEVFAEPGITRTVAARPVREHDKWTLHAIGHDGRVLVKVQIGGQEN